MADFDQLRASVSKRTGPLYVKCLRAISTEETEVQSGPVHKIAFVAFRNCDLEAIVAIRNDLGNHIELKPGAETGLLEWPTSQIHVKATKDAKFEYMLLGAL